MRIDGPILLSPIKMYALNETKPVDEATQAQYYVDAIHAVEQQPNVRMFFIFHVVDESRLEGLQTGTRYADGSPKSSEAAVKAALNAASGS